MKTINLYFKFQFTSLSPDAQPISLGIVSEERIKPEFIAAGTAGVVGVPKLHSKSFYAEFSDFDINRCDDWVKENVVSKLKFYDCADVNNYDVANSSIKSNTDGIKGAIRAWLSQFSDYQIQFIGDCCTWDWYWMVQLLGEWEEIPYKFSIDAQNIPKNMTLKEFSEQWKEDVASLGATDALAHQNYASVIIEDNVKTGLPKLPDNISPVPEDLNNIIRNNYLRKVKSLATTWEAFDANRETVLYLIDENKHQLDLYEIVKGVYKLKSMKHNALFDAKVIKEIYTKLK